MRVGAALASAPWLQPCAGRGSRAPDRQPHRPTGEPTGEAPRLRLEPGGVGLPCLLGLHRRYALERNPHWWEIEWLHLRPAEKASQRELVARLLKVATSGRASGRAW